MIYNFLIFLIFIYLNKIMPPNLITSKIPASYKIQWLHWLSTRDYANNFKWNLTMLLEEYFILNLSVFCKRQQYFLKKVFFKKFLEIQNNTYLVVILIFYIYKFDSIFKCKMLTLLETFLSMLTIIFPFQWVLRLSYYQFHFGLIYLYGT